VIAWPHRLQQRLSPSHDPYRKIPRQRHFLQFLMKYAIALLLLTNLSHASPLIVIAHRGASGYLPEHTLEAKTLAIQMGADFVEQDVVLSKDNVPFVTHDITLDEVTDVATRFPGRARADGHYYVLDFNAAELRLLARHERVKDGRAVYPRRFPLGASHFVMVSLADEIEFVQGINKTTGGSVGLYTEVKRPAWHREQGRDITKVVLAMLAHYGYTKRTDAVYFQCFDADENKRVRHELHSDLKIIQLIGDNADHEAPTDYDAMKTEAGMADVATYADGIGPSIDDLLVWPTSGAAVRVMPLAALAKTHHLLIHPYTLRIDALPRNAPSAQAVLDALTQQVKVDGLFSDFPDVVVRYRAAH
jgi:glycerophosphoryl diester phosphodiesterase